MAQQMESAQVSALAIREMAKRAYAEMARTHNTAHVWNAAPSQWDNLPPGQQHAWCRMIRQVAQEVMEDRIT